MEVLIWLLLAILVVGGPAALYWRRHVEAKTKPPVRQRVVEACDTVADWPPTATRVLSVAEREAYEVLLKALPDHMVLAQVPLSRFIRVPTRYSYGEWLNRVGQLSADLVICLPTSEVQAVVEIRGSAQDGAGSQKRHQRMVRVLKAAGIHVVVWPEGQLPSPHAARLQLFPLETQGAPVKASEAASPISPAEADVVAPAAATPEAAKAAPAAPADASKVQDLRDLPPREPPPTTWFDNLDGGKAPPRE